MRNKTDVDVIREIACDNGSYHTNSFYIEISDGTYGRKVTQNSVISAIGAYRYRSEIPPRILRSGKRLLSLCDDDLKLAQRVLVSS